MPKPFNSKLKTQTYIKLLLFTIIGIFSLKLVNSNNAEIQVINSPDNDNSDSGFQETLAKLDRSNNKIIIDGITYDLKDPNGLHVEEPGYKSMKTNEIIFSLVNVLFAVLTAGLMSGLTVGYLSIDEWNLQINLNKDYSDNESSEKKKYQEIAEVLRDRHWLLVTLLLCNATAMEALPIFLNRLVNEVESILISVTAVLIFGEIIPQAFCCGPSQIDIAYIMSKPTKLLMYATSPLSYPIARSLDYIIGQHKNKLLNSEELKTLVKLHTAKAVKKIMGDETDSDNSPKNQLLHDDEEGVGLDKSIAVFIQNVIDIKKIPVTRKFTPIDKVIYVDCETPITKEIVIDFINKGVSRVPVVKNQNKNEMIGYIRTVDFLKADLNNNLTIRDKVVDFHKPIVTDPSTSVYDLFSSFKNGNHLAFITEQKDLLQRKIGNPDILTSKISIDKILNQEIKIIGIVTLEDILEAIIGEDIKDESEQFKAEKISRSRKAFINRFKNKISSVVNDVVAKSLKKTMTLRNETWYDHHDFKEDDYDYHPNNNFTNNNYSLLRDRNNV